MKPRAARIGALGCVLIYVTGLAFSVGYFDNKASCDRHNDLVPHLNAQARYARDAATARERSAAHEAFSDPGQADIDRWAAIQFRIEAAAIAAPYLDCTGPLPATH